MSKQDEPEWMLDKLREMEQRGELIRRPPGWKPPRLTIADFFATEQDMSAPTPPSVRIVYRNGAVIECPVRYLGWKQPNGKGDFYHCWRVLNEGPFDGREGDSFESTGGTMPRYIECPGTGEIP